MCGFAGFVGKVEDRETVLVNMMDTIIHRGPDSAGKYVDEDAALGFRRLSIIDLSSVGDQPLYNEDKSMVLVFNGEIYNYQELRKELIEAGHVFVSNTDSETLIHGYEQWGEKLVDRLRGMYAFVIWDTKKKRLFGKIFCILNLTVFSLVKSDCKRMIDLSQISQVTGTSEI